MIQAIIDSGSTKADWRILKNDNIFSFRTVGYNPYFISPQEMESIIREEVLPHFSSMPPERLFFYGAGCAAEGKKKEIMTVLTNCFPTSTIVVETDLMGAARALLGNKPGLVAVLGTGTNTGFYNGDNFQEQVEGGGFILGDEGSGAYLGKLILISWLRKTFSKETDKDFNNFCPYTRDEIIDAIYRKPFPNRFLARFSHFAKENLNVPEIHKIINQSFEDFFGKIISLYPGYKTLPLNFAGSIASIFNNDLKQCVEDRKLILGNIIRSPIDNLVDYHISAG
jgi:N-acetylglucosamine kinase-like BadF-type ATPase